MSLTDPNADALGTILDRFRATTLRKLELVNGLGWETFDTGEGSPTLVSLPGAVGGGEGSFFLAESLRPAIRVLACGIPAVATIEQAVGGLRSCLRARGVGPAVLLGASYSGLIVQAYVRAYPDEVSAIVLSHTGVLDRSRVAVNRRAAGMVKALPPGLTRGLLRLLVRALTRGVPEARFWRELYGRFIAGASRDLLVSRYVLTADLCARPPWSPDDLRDWPGRVLIIESDDDRVASPETRARLRVLYPQAQVRTFAGTGHSTAMARPREYADAVRAFALAQASPAGHRDGRPGD